MRNVLLPVLLLALTLTVSAQTKSGLDENGVYRNPDIGFSFHPPSGLTDVTKRSPNSNDDQSAVKLLLFELSGPDSNDLEWRGVAVQSFPRKQVKVEDDGEAEAKLSRTIIGNAKPVAAPKHQMIGGIDFVVTEFERHRGLLTEHSKVFTTIIHGEMVAFAFTANSTANIDAMAQCLETLKAAAK